MTDFSVRVQDDQITPRLRRLVTHLEHLTPVMEDIGRALGNITEDAFQSETSPWGQRWAPLDAAYVRRARKGNAHPILQRTGGLAASVTAGGNNQSAWVGVSKVYAAIHQFGGTIQHQARTGTVYFKQGRDGTVGKRFVRKSQSNFAQDYSAGAHTQTLPPRPFLPISADGALAPVAQTVVLGILERYLGF